MRDGGGGGGLPAGLPSAGDELQVDRDVLRDVAKRLHDDLQQLRGSGNGTLHDLRNNGGLVSPNALGDYPAGQGISQTFNQAYTQIGTTYESFLSTYEQVIQSIQQSVDGYQAAEDATQQSAQRAASTGSSSPPSQSAGGGGGGGGGAW